MSNAHRIQRPTTDSVAKQKQQVRLAPDGCWEVYTFLTGSIHGPWKWFKVTQEIADWYIQVHHVPVVPYPATQENSNEII